MTYDYDLEQAAIQRAAEAAVQLSHSNSSGHFFTSCQGWSLNKQSGTTGYETGAENLAGGNYANGEIMVHFLKEEDRANQGHRLIMLDSKYKAVGIAHAYLSWADVGKPGETVSPHARDYWVQIFRTYNGNAKPTTAKMGRATLPVAADKNWCKLKLAPDRSYYTLKVGGRDTLPNVMMMHTSERKWELNEYELAEKVKWTISNPFVAAINGNTIVAQGGGSATLTGTCGNFSVSIPITVSGKPYIPKTVAAPTLTKAVCANGTVTMAWKNVPGVPKYRVIYRTETGGWKTLGETKSTSLRADKTRLRQGTKYTFAVRCLNDQGKYWSSRSNTKTLLYRENYTAPEIKTVQAVQSGIKLSWKKVSGAEQYRILYREYGKGSWKKLADTSKLTYTWRKAKPGIQYAFTVRCVTADGKRSTSGYNKSGKSCGYLPMAQITGVSTRDGVVSVSVKQPKSSLILTHSLHLYDSRGVERDQLTLAGNKTSWHMKLPEAGEWHIRVQTEGFVRTGVGSSEWTRIENPADCVVRWN